MPWTGTSRQSIFAASGPPKPPSPVGRTGGGGTGGGGTGGSLHTLDEFPTGPFLTPPAGAALTGTSSLQRAFPERIGGDAFQQSSPEQPNLFEQALSIPAMTMYQPVALADKITGGGVNQFLTDVSHNVPIIGDVLGAAGGAVETFFSIPKALMNHDATVVMKELWKVDRNEVITPELMQKHGLDPKLAQQFRKNGAPLLGLIGITGEQMTVGDLQDELKGRNFLMDPETGKDMSWHDWTNKVNDNPLGDFSMGHAAANENAITDFLLESGGMIAEIALLSAVTGGVGGAARAGLGLGTKGAQAVAQAEAIANAASGAGKIATAAGKTTKWYSGFSSPIAKVLGQRVGDNVVKDFAAEGVIKATASPVVQGVAELAAGDATGMSIKSLAGFMGKMVKAVTLPEVTFGGKSLNWLMRYQIGQTRLRAGLFGAEQVSGFVEDQGINVPQLAAVHDFTQGVLDNHIIADDTVFGTAALFAFPFKAAIGDIARPISSPVGKALGRSYLNLGRRSMKLLEDPKVGLGPGAVEKLGGVERAAMWMDRMAQDIAFEKRMRGLPEGERVKWNNAVEATLRMSYINTAVKATADFMIRRGEITAHDLVTRFRNFHENPTITKTLEDGTRSRRPMLPFNTKLSNDTIIDRANTYMAALEGIKNPLVGTHTAVLARASRLSVEDLELAVQIAQDAAKIDGTLDSQFVRDLFYKTPGLLDDLNLSEKAHDWLVEAMNPANNKTWEANEVIGILKNLKDLAPTRDQMWREMDARDAAAMSDPAAVAPPGVIQNGVARNIHSVESGKRYQIEADGQVRAMGAERTSLLERYRGMFSKRGNYKPSLSDQNWRAGGENAVGHMATAEVGHFSPVSAVERGYTKGFDVPTRRIGVIPEGDVAGLESAARAIRNSPDFKGADVRLTQSVDMPGHYDVSASWHFRNQPAAEAKAAEIGVDTIFDSSKVLTPRQTLPVTPVPKQVLDAKVAEVSSAMGLSGDEAVAAGEVLRALSETHARNYGGSPVDYLNRIEYTRGGKSQAERLFQQEVEPYLDVLDKYNMGVTKSTRQMLLPNGDTALLPEGPMTLGDAWVLKLQGVHPQNLTPEMRTTVYSRLFEAQTRELAGDPVDAFRRAVFSMLSPNNNLTNNEIGLASLGIRTFGDIVRIAKSSQDEVVKKIMSANAGKIGIGDNAGRIIRLAKRLVEDQTALDLRPGETPGAYLSRIASENGFNMKTANFATMLADPARWSIGTVDVHIVRSLIEGELSKLLKPGELDPALVARYKARVKNGVYPQPSARTVKGGKVYEGSDYQKFADALTIALERKYPESQFGPAGKQWMAWDEIRNRIEPHTAVWPKISDLPRLTAEELKAAKAVHTDARYLARGAVEGMGPDAVFFQREGAAKGAIKGSTEFPLGNDIRAIVRGYEKSDISTFLHEAAHVNRRLLQPDDIAIAERHYGVRDGKWTRAHEERYARDFERYFRDGKAPTPQLESVFAKIAAVMRKIYSVLRGSPIGERVSPEIRDLFDRQLGKTQEASAIKLSNVAPEVGVEPPPIRFQQEDAALRLQREELRQQIHDVDRRIKRTKQEIKNVRERVDMLKKTNTKVHESWEGYNSDGSPKTSYPDVQRVETYVNWVRENYPEYEVVAGPRIMNLYNPGSNVIKNLMLESDAMSSALFDWGPVSKMTNALQAAVDRWLRPVRGAMEHRDTTSRIYEVLMKLGAKRHEVDKYLESINDHLMNERTIGLKHEQVPLTRGMNAMGARQLSNIAISAFGSNTGFVQAFEKRFGGQGLEHSYVAITEAYNPAIRAIQRTIEQGGKVNRLQRLWSSGYDAYHVGTFSGLASSTHFVAKYLYPLVRFAFNPMYHVYNATEADIIGLTQDGMRVALGGAGKYAKEIGKTLEQGNPEARGALLQARRRAQHIGLDPAVRDVQDALLRGATIDQTGSTFGMNTRRQAIIERQVDLRRPETIMDAIKTFAADDPAIVAARKRYNGTVDDWVDGLTRDIYGLDEMGARKYVEQLVKEEGWTQSEYRAMQPLVNEIVNRMQAQFDDMYQIHVGNVNRSRLERVVNSYWLYWPASYMLKANKWMFKVLTEGAFGKKTGLGGAWGLNELAKHYHEKYLTDANFRQLVDDNSDLEFALSQIMPVVPWSDGVSLNRMTRYVGGHIGLWPQYTNFDPLDWASWGKKMSDIGPVYSFGLISSINDNLAKDFDWPNGPFDLGAPGGIFDRGTKGPAPAGGQNPINTQGL